MRRVWALTLAAVVAATGTASAEYLSEKLQAFLDPAFAGPKPTVGILCKLPGSRTAGDTPPAREFRDLKEFLSVAYAAPKAGRTVWHGDTRRHELHIVGGVVPPYKPEAAAFLKEQTPPAEATLEGAIKLFDWFVDTTPKRVSRDKPATALEEAFREVIGTPAVNMMYCNQAASLFRTVLAQRGIVSRVVCVFAADDYNKGGHTFVEVWDPAQGKWLFFDPKFAFYSTTQSAADVLYKSSHLCGWSGIAGLSLDRREEGKTRPVKAPRAGAAFWYIENGETGERIEFRDVGFYSDK